MTDGDAMPEHTTAARITEATRLLDVATSSLLVAVSRRVGVSAPEMLALELLGREGELGPSELAAHLQMTTGAVTALVDRLEERCFVVRERHPSDRRRVILRRTPAAAAAIDAQYAALEADISAMGESLDDAERAAVGAFVDRLVTVVERHAEEACAS
jgi:DNA-binding MarR family transcriptional regulator